MTMYVNVSSENGKHAFEVATIQGWADFCTWTKTLPKQFKGVKAMAKDGGAKSSVELEDELIAAVKAKPPEPSAGEVAARLIEVMPHRGTFGISDDPEEDEDEEDWEKLPDDEE